MDCVISASSTSAPTITTPTGWSILAARTPGSDNGAAPFIAAIAYDKVADGSEGGTSPGVTTSANATMAAQVFRITSWAGSLAFIVAGTPVTSAQGLTVDPPSTAYSPTSDILTIATAHDNGIGTFTSGPSGYGAVTTTTATNARMYSVSLQSTAAASPADPGVFTWTVNNYQRVANTFVVLPVPIVSATRTPQWRRNPMYRR